MKALREVKA